MKQIVILLLIALFLLILFLLSYENISSKNRILKDLKLPLPDTVSKNSANPWCVGGIAYVFAINGKQSSSISGTDSQTQTYPMFTLTRVKDGISSPLTSSDKVTITKTVNVGEPKTFELSVGSSIKENGIPTYEITTDGVFIDYVNPCTESQVAPLAPVAPVAPVGSNLKVGEACYQIDFDCANKTCGYVRTKDDYRCCENGIETVASKDYCKKELKAGEVCRFDTECKHGNCKGNWSGTAMGICN